MEKFKKIFTRNKTSTEMKQLLESEAKCRLISYKPLPEMDQRIHEIVSNEETIDKVKKSIRKRIKDGVISFFSKSKTKNKNIRKTDSSHFYTTEITPEECKEQLDVTRSQDNPQNIKTSVDSILVEHKPELQLRIKSEPLIDSEGNDFDIIEDRMRAESEMTSNNIVKVNESIVAINESEGTDTMFVERHVPNDV